MDGRSKIENIRIEKSPSLTFVWIAVCLFLILCITVPLVFVFITPGAADFKTVFSSSVWKQAALNTLLEALCSTFTSVLIGFIYAYAVVKGDIPGKKFFAMIPFLHLLTPPFVGGLAFILLLGRQGFITKTLLGLDISLYGFPGLLIAQTLCFFPMAYMICAQTLENISPTLEQVAKSLGVSRRKVFFKITLPLAAPGIISSILYVAVSVMSDFGNPMIVAGRYRVLAVEIYTQLTGWMNKGTSAVLGIILVIPSIVLFVLQNKFAEKNMTKLAVIGGRSSASSSVNNKSGLLARLLLTLFCAFITLCIVAQFAAIIAGSFQKLWGIDVAFTWNHIKNIARCKKELLNSVRFALYAAFFSTLIASLCAFLVSRTKCPLKKYMDSVIQLPAAIPGTLFGLAILLASSKIGFRNSSLLIITAITIGFIPFSYRTITAAYSQIKMTLDDGASVLGASKLRVLFFVIMPIAKEGVFNSFIYDFVRGVGTMSAVIFLVSFNTPLASIKILNLAEQGFWGDAAALALLLTLITFGVLVIGKKILSRIGR